MLVPMPIGTNYSRYIQQFIQEFHTLFKMPYIRTAYKSGVSGITTHDAMMNQVSEDGHYWNVLENATREERTFQSCESLAVVLRDCSIKQIVFNQFGLKKEPNSWTDTVHAYAFGN